VKSKMRLNILLSEVFNVLAMVDSIDRSKLNCFRVRRE
jgi:hypothetical protein